MTWYIGGMTNTMLLVSFSFRFAALRLLPSAAYFIHSSLLFFNIFILFYFYFFQLNNPSLQHTPNTQKVSIDPTRSEGWTVFALWHDSCGDREEALVSIEKALKINPKSYLAHRIKGDLLLAMDKSSEAVLCFFKAKV
jgi:tetratricopeptide (TPR) repeat protein